MVQLYQLGFPLEKIELVVLGLGVTTVDDALDYLLKGSSGYWEHRFIPRAEITRVWPASKCISCLGKKQEGHLNPTPAPEPPARSSRERVVPADLVWAENGFVMKNVRYHDYAGKSRRTHRAKEHSCSESMSEFARAADPSQSQISLSMMVHHPTGEERFCFVCGDFLEEHDPSAKEGCGGRLPRSTARTEHTQVAQDHSVVSEDDQTTCRICLSSAEPILALNCKHKFCASCLRRYLTISINTNAVRGKDTVVECPMAGCDEPVPNGVIHDCVEPALYRKHMIYSSSPRIPRQFDEDNVIFCPVCSHENRLGSTQYSVEKTKILCELCSTKLCVICKKMWHRGQTCEESVSASYNRLALGRDWQLCPNCKAVVHKAPECCHMMCRQCLLMFCISCRRRNGHGHTADSEKCAMHRTVSSIGQYDSRRSASVCSVVTLLLLYILLSPLIALFMVPYVVFRNFNNQPLFLALSATEEPQQQANSGSSFMVANSSVLVMRRPGEEAEEVRPRCLCLEASLAAVGAVVISPVTCVGMIILGICLFVYYMLN